MAGNGAIQFLRGSNVASAYGTTTLLAGQPCYDLTNKRLYIGDGSTALSGLTPLGTAGPTGATGATGAVGPTGANGVSSSLYWHYVTISGSCDVGGGGYFNFSFGYYDTYSTSNSYTSYWTSKYFVVTGVASSYTGAVYNLIAANPGAEPSGGSFTATYANVSSSGIITKTDITCISSLSSDVVTQIF